MNVIIKIRAEVSEKETKKTMAKLNKMKIWFFENINQRPSISQSDQGKKGKKKGWWVWWRRIQIIKLEMKIE